MLIETWSVRRSKAGALQSGQQRLQLSFQQGRPDTLLLEADRGTEPVFDKIAVERPFGLSEIQKGSIGRAGLCNPLALVSKQCGFIHQHRSNRLESRSEPIEDVEPCLLYTSDAADEEDSV